MSEDLDALGRRLAAEFPAVTVRRGWTVANLSHAFERTPNGVEELWSVDIYGPIDIDTDWHHLMDGERFATARLSQRALGKVESPTADGLVDMVQRLVDDLGIRDLKDQKPRRSAVSTAVPAPSTASDDER